MTVLNLNPLEWQLRRQIGLLGLMVLVTVTLAAALALSAHRHSEAARVANAQHSLDRAMGRLAENFHHFRASLPERQAVEPLDPDDDERSCESLPQRPSPGRLESKADSTRSGTAKLLGYAFPTYQGTGPKTDIPPAERPTIEKVVEAAVATERKPRSEQPQERTSFFFAPAHSWRTGSP